MVKVGFICEGFTELILLQSPIFKQFLNDLNITSVNVINAEGCGNLLPHKIAAYLARLEQMGAETIIILSDLDLDICITETKNRISARFQDKVIIAVKQIESWFLACNTTMRKILNSPNFQFPLPENENNPFATINNLLVAHVGKNNGGKIKLVTRLVNEGLDLREAASHPNCPSAKYFLDKLTEIGATV